MTRIEAMAQLSVVMNIDAVKDNIALINKIYDDFEKSQDDNLDVMMFPASDGDWGRVEAILMPDGDWIEIGGKEEEE